MIKKLCLFIFLSIASVAYTNAQDAANAGDDSEIRIVGDPGKGMFKMVFNLPKDAKKTTWTVTGEDGTVIIKEKYKNLKAGENKIEYNYLYGPDGLHTFKIETDEGYTASTQVRKERKKN